LRGSQCSGNFFLGAEITGIVPANWGAGMARAALRLSPRLRAATVRRGILSAGRICRVNCRVRRQGWGDRCGGFGSACHPVRPLAPSPICGSRTDVTYFANSRLRSHAARDKPLLEMVPAAAPVAWRWPKPPAGDLPSLGDVLCSYTKISPRAKNPRRTVAARSLGTKPQGREPFPLPNSLERFR